MSDFIIEASSDVFVPEPQMPKTYLIKYTKAAKDLEGNEVVVIDENRTEQVTVESLEAQKVALQEQAKQIDEKIAIIKAL